MLFLKRNLLFLFVFLSIFLSSSSIAKATTCTWSGGTGNWEDTGNWSGCDGSVPDANDDVIIDVSQTISINGSATINSLTVGDAGRTNLPTLNFNYDAHSNGALIIDDGNFILHDGASLTHTESTTSTATATISIDVQSGDTTLTGNVNLTSQGFNHSEGPGAGEDSTASRKGTSGASHGGEGSDGYGTLGTTTGAVAYGSFDGPITLGSGGGDGKYNVAANGGDGGGAIKISTAGTMTIDGNITANGTNGGVYGGDWSGAGGSGGSIWLIANTIAGSGSLQANGGNGGVSTYTKSGAGAGGRIVLEYTTKTLSGSITAYGGDGTSEALDGGAGVICEKPSSQTYCNVTINNGTNTNYTVTPLSNQTIHDLTVDNAKLSHQDNSTTATYKLDLTIMGDATITSDASIDTDGRGFDHSEGTGTGTDNPGARKGSGGAGHGGVGNDGTGDSGGQAGGLEYGSITDPITLGSGGGDGLYNTAANGGSGGGAIKLTISGTLTVNGTISANGDNGGVYGNDWSGGGGSGGSVWLLADTITGSGTIQANGGNGGTTSYTSSGGGAGGYVRLFSYSSNTFSGSIATIQGTGGANGADGVNTSSTASTISNLAQTKSDGSTAITTGSSTDETTVILKVSMEDNDSANGITAQVEVQPIGTDFINTATHTGTEEAYSASTITSAITVDSLSDTTSYHWQARACDFDNACSPWSSFGGNAENAADFQIILNLNPNAPSSLGPSTVVGSNLENTNQPTFQFALSDGDTSDLVKYQIQIATDVAFSNVVTDYTSALAAQGSAEFTVGQAAGSGSYTTGSEGQTLSGTNYYWRVKTIDDNDASSDWTTASGSPSFSIDLVSPILSGSTSISTSSGTPAIDPTTTWLNSPSPYFTWTTGTDNNSLKGYCLYIGTDSSGDPSTQKGLLGSSPVSTTGTTCQFIVSSNEVDFATTAYRGDTWLTSSTSDYYIKIKAIDNAGNLSTTTISQSFQYDYTNPTNVTAISAASGSFSSISDMYINWPTSGDQAAVDAHSGILGYQYALNSPSGWTGPNTDSSLGISYIPLGQNQPYYLSGEFTTEDLEIGGNTVYFRTVDAAGNFSSSYATATVNYGGEAPSFAFDGSLTVTPATNTENSFALSWSEASPATDRTISTYYYMINTTPPSSLSTITQNTATYIATTNTSVAAQAFQGVRKGSNTVYVVAVDDNDNYSPSNYLSSTFTLNSDLPDPATNLAVADSSIKSASIWRASLAWDVPSYQGTGDLTYTIQRSTDGDTWSTITTTTGTAYVDTVPESQQYYWRIGTSDTSDDSTNNPTYTNAVTLTPKGAYTEPAGLSSGPSVSSITTKKATVSWTTSRTSDSKVAFGTSSGDYQDEEVYNGSQVTDHSLQLNNLEPGTTYYYVVRWTDEDGNTGESDEETFTTSPAPTVKDIEVSSVGLSTAILKFTTNDATQAKIYYGKTTDFGGSTTISTSTLESTYTIELSELEDDTKYYFKINTFDEEESEYEGSILDFTTLPRPKISNVRIQQVKNTAQSTLSISWDSNTEISSIVTYFPEGKPDFARDEVDVKLTADRHEIIIKGLLPDTTYFLTVRGRDKIGNEALSDSIKFTTATDTRPPVITNLTVEGTSIAVQRNQDNPSQLIVSWTTDEPSTSQVEIGEGTSDNYSQLTQEDSDYSYNHVVVIPNLAPASVYHLRAISRDMANNEIRSVDTVTITPKATDNALDLVITNLREAFGFLE